MPVDVWGLLRLLPMQPCDSSPDVFVLSLPHAEALMQSLCSLQGAWFASELKLLLPLLQGPVLCWNGIKLWEWFCTGLGLWHLSETRDGGVESSVLPSVGKVTLMGHSNNKPNRWFLRLAVVMTLLLLVLILLLLLS